MSRISRSRILPGDPVDAADLNTRYDDYSQAGALNAFNVRDAAFDLPQMQSDWFASAIYEHTLGEASLLHTSFNTVNAFAADLSGHLVQNFSGAPSILSFGAGVSIDTEEVFRVYWDLSVSPIYTGTPWTALGNISSYTFPDLPKTGTVQTATSAAVWLLYLEWDVTSAARTNFVPVPGQGDFRFNVSGPYFGEQLANCGATTVFPAWIQAATNASDGGVTAAGLVNQNVGWRGVSGAWHYSGAEDGAVTVYGLRWVIRGILHPYQTGGVNYLVHDFVAGDGPSLRYTSGKAQVLVHRVE